MTNPAGGKAAKGELVLETNSFLALLLTLALLLLSLHDLRTRRLPDILTLPLMVLGLTLPVWADASIDVLTRALGAGIGFLVLWSLSVVFRRVRGYPGLGLGDAKLLAAAGAWLGPWALAPLVLIASASALLCAGALHLSGREIGARTILPFGPFLSLGFLLLWLAHGAGWSFP